MCPWKVFWFSFVWKLFLYLNAPGANLVQDMCVLKRVWLFFVARQAPLSMDFPGKNTGVGCHFQLQGIFLTQGWNPPVLHLQEDSLSLSHLWSPVQDPQGFHSYPFLALWPWASKVFMSCIWKMGVRIECPLVCYKENEIQKHFFNLKTLCKYNWLSLRFHVCCWRPREQPLPLPSGSNVLLGALF